jgi:hypothetical protein
MFRNWNLEGARLGSRRLSKPRGNYPSRWPPSVAGPVTLAFPRLTPPTSKLASLLRIKSFVIHFPTHGSISSSFHSPTSSPTLPPLSNRSSSRKPRSSHLPLIHPQPLARIKQAVHNVWRCVSPVYPASPSPNHPSYTLGLVSEQVAHRGLAGAPQWKVASFVMRLAQA